MEVINRERWRRYAKGKMTKEELALLISDMANDISKDLINEKCYNTNVLFRAAILLHMHDKYGYGKKRLLTLLDELEKTLEAYEEGYISINDMIQTLKEETGVELVVEHWKGESNGKKHSLDNRRDSRFV